MGYRWGSSDPRIVFTICLFNYLWVFVVLKSTLQLRKQKSYSHNRKQNNRHFPSEIIPNVFISWSCYTPPHSLSSVTRLPALATQLHYLLPTVFSFKSLCRQWRTERGVWGVQNPPPKFWRYRWSPRSHKQEEPASRFPFVVHCVLIRL